MVRDSGGLASLHVSECALLEPGNTSHYVSEWASLEPGNTSHRVSEWALLEPGNTPHLRSLLVSLLLEGYPSVGGLSSCWRVSLLLEG